MYVPKLSQLFFLFLSKIGATISENESFSLASYEDGLPANFNTTQRSSIPSIEAAPFNQEQPMTAAINQEPCAEADIEATNVTTMLPVNHVIQYSPRTASAPDWPASFQLYQNQQIEAGASNQNLPKNPKKAVIIFCV